jgi:hypothetical protein
MIVTVYSSGGVQKPGDTNKLCWTDAERDLLASAARPHTLVFFDPDGPVADISNMLALFGRDMYQIQASDVVVVDARQRRGIGIGGELVAAVTLGKPVIVVAPRNSHYRIDRVEYQGAVIENYIHPYLSALAESVVETFEAAGQWIKDHVENPIPARDKNVLAHAIAVYADQLLPNDPYTLAILRLAGGT